MRMTGILDSAPNAHCDNQAKQTNHEALFGISWFLLLGSDQTVAENRLILAANSGLGTTASYTYDGDGNRVSKTVNGVTTDYVVDTQNPTGYAQVLAEIQNGEVVKRYTYGHDLISMERKDGSNWIASYYGYDGTGSVRALTDSTGVVTDSYDYDAFGTLLYSSGSTPNEYLFHGERKDPETGLVYLRARYMDPSIGRFMTMDSYEGSNDEPLSLHKYMFVTDNPVNKNDPTGLFSIKEGCTGLFRLVFEHMLGKRVQFKGNFKKYLSTWSTDIYIPTDVDVDANVNVAFDMGITSWINHIRPEGVWDYKYQYGSMYKVWAGGAESVPEPLIYQRLANLGNFNFGATGKALRVMGVPWFTDMGLLSGAGVAEYSKREDKYGAPWSSPTYGDRPEDQEWIKRGINYFKENYREE